eukprot:scaffold16302_cov136-Isochrysis_galbana.AAC.3
MAPRQLTLPPMEVDMNLEPGSQRVRPSNAEKSSMQVRLRACASACGTSWPGLAHWLALLALPWANDQSLPLLAREECAAKTLLSVAATPFTTTASAVYYNPLRSTELIPEQFVAFKRPSPKLFEWPEPRALSTTPICIHQIVPILIDPSAPTEAELAGDEPPSKTVPHTLYCKSTKGRDAQQAPLPHRWDV